METAFQPGQPSAQLLAAAQRTDHLARLGDEHFDVLVVGGGITGAGVALDAAARGYRVALVEKADFAGGTSSKSTKLVHGGIRYLPEFDFGLVREALSERGILLQIAPFLVQPIGFVLPIYQGDRHPVGLPFSTPGGVGLGLLLNLGLWFYDRLAGRRNMRRHRHLSRARVLELAPGLVAGGLREGFLYYDGQTNDARLTMALIRTAAHYAAVVASYTEVTAFLVEDNRVCGACLRDRLSGHEIRARARHVVNATGVFSEEVEKLLGESPQAHIEPSKGVHLVFAREDVRIGEHAIVLPETDDRRLLFLVPWQSRVLFGTTDSGSGDLGRPLTTREDIAYLMNHLNRYLAADLDAGQIISTYAGYRPLVRPGQGTAHSSARLSRTHAVLESPSGLVTIVGGKLTTYRQMAQDTVDVLSRRDGRTLVHPTQRLLLCDSADWPAVQQEIEKRGAALGLTPAVLRHLGWAYGAGALHVLQLVAREATLGQLLVADLPYIRAEVLHACREELALTPSDVLERRTSITLEDRQRGLGCVEEVATLMAQELGWLPAYTRRMVEEYRTAVLEQLAAEQA
ncbi:MAG TPA: glycerol-3-phosphate dehydrogenase/oxidase [Ktedonobacteraceae bacterium]